MSLYRKEKSEITDGDYIRFGDKHPVEIHYKWEYAAVLIVVGKDEPVTRAYIDAKIDEYLREHFAQNVEELIGDHVEIDMECTDLEDRIQDAVFGGT